MLFAETYIHSSFINSTFIQSPTFLDFLKKRQDELLNLIAEKKNMVGSGTDSEDISWATRSYSVLSILAPVMSSYEGKIEFPGDPMCLYSALSLAVDQVVKAKASKFDEQDPYNDLCPNWGVLPSSDYRENVSHSGIRDHTHPLLNTDQTIFDPRVWNDEVKSYFVSQVLNVVRPKVVLISSVSPGHRYAIDIAKTVRLYFPNTLIVLGGRHADETMRYLDDTGELSLAYSSTLQTMRDGRVPPVFDFVVSGDGYYAIDILMKAISLSMDIQEKVSITPNVVYALKELASIKGLIPGHWLIAALNENRIDVFPNRGPKVDLAELPSPYKAFAVRGRFPIFQSESGKPQLTAHMLMTSACPYHCNFCSEGITVVGRMLKFTNDPVNAAIKRICEYCSYGAEAIFFDDSVFWGGNISRITAFCEQLSELRQSVASNSNTITPYGNLDTVTLQRFLKLQWGAQLTVEFLSSFRSREEAIELLNLMQKAGCTYLYMGIESLSSTVMSNIHKNVRKNKDSLSWKLKVRLSLEIAQEARIRVGTSVLFGLEGENRNTIEDTIQGIEEFIMEGLIHIASPNILTYHPATEITHAHSKEDSLDYHTLNIENRPPYIYFEEAFPNVVSKYLSEDDIWYIHTETKACWGARRNNNPMTPVLL